MTAETIWDRADRIIAEGRARRERERAELAKLITTKVEEQKALVAEFGKLDAKLVDILKRINVLEKQKSADAVQPKPPELASWSPERLAAVLSQLSPDELDKLKQ